VANTAAGGSERPSFQRLRALFSTTFWSLPTADPEHRWRTARADARAIRSHRWLWFVGAVLVVAASEILAFSTSVHGATKALLVAVSAGFGALVLLWGGSWGVALAMATRRQRNEAIRQRDNMRWETKDLQQQLDGLKAELQEARRPRPIDDVAKKVLGTELREIRTDIEKIKATNPPSYPPGFQFPGEAWTKHGPALEGDTYDRVESAYVAAHHVTKFVQQREAKRRVGNRQPNEVHPEDKLDEVHGLAGEALDALGERHNKPFKTPYREAAEQIAGDIVLERLSELIRLGELLYDSSADYNKWIAEHAVWRDRLRDELFEADRVRAFDFSGLSEGEPSDDKDLEPARRRVDRIVGNLRKLHDEYYRGER
jgi:hypothetical protein